MTISTKILLVELVMSIDRMIESAKVAQEKQAQEKPGEWNPATVLGHVSQVDELVWLPRVQLMVNAKNDSADEPEFAWWEPDPIATAEKFSNLGLDEVSAATMQSRTKLVTYLNTLSAEQWDARANHATFGSIDVRELIFQTLTHDEEHRASFV